MIFYHAHGLPISNDNYDDYYGDDDDSGGTRIFKVGRGGGKQGPIGGK